MHICRSALSCCVISGLPHNVIKAYCEPRDNNTSPWDQLEDNQDDNNDERIDEFVIGNDGNFDFTMNDIITPD